MRERRWIGQRCQLFSHINVHYKVDSPGRVTLLPGKRFLHIFMQGHTSISDKNVQYSFYPGGEEKERKSNARPALSIGKRSKSVQLRSSLHDLTSTSYSAQCIKTQCRRKMEIGNVFSRMISPQKAHENKD